jgi:hypothetical protein
MLPRKIGQILIANGVLTEDALNTNLIERHRRIGEVLVDNKILTKEHIDTALAIQRKERIRFAVSMSVLSLILIFVSAFFISNLNKNKGIVIQEAKIATGVDKDMAPIKVTNFFPKNTSKVSAWISWKNAKINTQILVKWYYITDDTPIYDYNLNIPKRDGIANVVLAMPEGKTLPSGLYKVTILSGKKQLTKPLTFEVQ